MDNAAPATAQESTPVTEKLTLQIERTYQAPIEAVFDAFTSEQVMRRWWHVHDRWETTEATVDLRVDGVIRVVMHDPDKDVEHGGGGEYTEVDPPRRLAFTWMWDRDRDKEDRRSLIEIDFEEAGDGTRVRFTHSGLLDAETVRDHEEGWNLCFDLLERELAS
jgi:uncharacterized protein YndB with AHSA1/START domain